MTQLGVFDDAERERVRHALKRYKELHGGIGDPELRARIEGQLRCTPRQVTLSTLQRFLRGTHHTDDEVVRRYKKFLMQVAPPPAEDELAAALLKFLAAEPEDKDWCRTYAGTYRKRILPQLGMGNERSAVRTEVLAERIAAARAMPPDTPYPDSGKAVVLEPNQSLTFLRATEAPLDPESWNQEHYRAMELPLITGVFIPYAADAFLMLMRDLWSARLYQLEVANKDPLILYGTAFEPGDLFLRSYSPASGPWKPYYDFEMAAIKDETAVASDTP